MVKRCTLIISLLFLSFVQAKENFYLTSEISSSDILVEEKSFIDSCLNAYHKSNGLKEQLQALNAIVEFSNADKVWTTYNKMIDQKVTASLDKVNETEKLELLKFKAGAINNYGFFSQIMGNNPQAIKEYEESIAIYAQIKDTVGWANGLNNLGSVYYFTGDSYKCLKSYRQALHLRESINDNWGIANSLNNIGMVFQEQGNLDKAITFFIEGLKIRKKIGDQNAISTQLSNIGGAYLEMEDISTALEYYEQAYEIDKKQSNKYNIASSLFNIGRCLQKTGRLKLAEENYQQSLELYFEIVRKKEIGQVYIALGEVYLALNQRQKAEKFLKLGIEQHKEADYKQGIAQAYINLSELALLNPSSLNNAEKYANLGLAVSDSLGSVDLMGKSYDVLFKINEKTGNYKGALNYHKLLKRMNDSIRNEQIKKRADFKQATYLFEQELGQKESEFNNEIDELSELNSLQSQVITLFIIGLVLIVLIFIFLIIILRNNVKKKNRNRERMKEKDLLLKEIHHRVKNSLQITSSLVAVQKSSIENIEAKDALAETQSRIEAISTVHELLYLQKDINSVPLNEYLSRLTNSSVDKNKISFNFSCPQMTINPDLASSVGLIVSEVISNSIKHGFKDNLENARIDFNVSDLGDSIKLVISNNGESLPQNFNSEPSESLGMSIIESLSEQIEGRFKLFSLDNETRFELLVPLLNN